MKLINRILSIAVAGTCFTGCLKDKDLFDPANTHNVVEFANSTTIASSTTSTYPLYNTSVDVVPSATYDAIISYSGADAAPDDISVEVVAAAQSVLDKYNTENSTAYVMIPTTVYSMPAKVTIPKGQHETKFTITYKSDQFDLSKKYALPLQIKSASTGVISGNFGTVIFAVSGKNKYDGVYTLKCRMAPAGDRPTFSNTTWNWAYDVQLVTTGANTVALYNSAYSADYTHPIQLTDGSNSRLGTFTTEFTFDASGKMTDAKNYILNPANGRSAVLNSAVTDSRYDATKKTVYAAFIMNQPGFAGLPFFDTLVYKKAR